MQSDPVITGPIKGVGPMTNDRVMACLIHGTIRAITVHTAKEFDGSKEVTYGLCFKCDRKLKTDPTFKVHIDKRLCETIENSGEKT